MSRATPEAFSRVVIDALLRDAGWTLAVGQAVLFEHPLPDGGRADYLLCDRNGRGLAVLEAKRTAVSPAAGEAQARRYAEQLGVPFIFLSNGNEVWFWEWQQQAHPHRVASFFSQADLERRAAAYQVRRDPLGIPIDRAIAGHDHQRDCIDTLCGALAKGQRKMLVEMATGTGKTRTAIALLKRLFAAGHASRALFLVDRIELAKQTEDAFAEHLSAHPAYRLQGTRVRMDAKQVTITTLQTMVGRLSEFNAGYFDIIFVDECHRTIYGEYRRVLDAFDAVKIGLTATPCVVSEATLAELAEEDRRFVRDTLRFFEVDRPTFRYTLRQAIADGQLVPYHIYRAMTVKTAAEGGFEVKRSDLDWAAIPADNREEWEAVFAGGESVVVDPNALERRFTIPERNRAIVREFREVLDKGYAGADGIRRFPQDGKTIVFAVTKRHAETLAHLFDAEFADRKPDPAVRYADFVVSGLGDDDTLDAGSRIKRFKREPYPKIMVSVNMLDTGFDYPDVVNLVMARFTRSSILYQQMRGRGARLPKAVKKPVFTIFDFVGVTAFHGDDEEAPAEGGIVAGARPPRQDSRPRTLLMLDVHDQIDPTTRGWVTLDDEGNQVPSNVGENRTAALGVAFEKFVLTHDGWSAEQVRLLRMIGQQIRANALTADGFDASRFTLPPFSGIGGYGNALRVFGGEAALENLIDALNIAVFQPAAGGDKPEADGEGARA